MSIINDIFYDNKFYLQYERKDTFGEKEQTPERDQL
jgi:hypothetical protein